MQIELVHLQAQNFMPFTHLDLSFVDRQGDVTVILGQNKDDSMALSNGSGKSAVMEAITYVLFGTPSREIQYADEIIKLGKADVRVALDFDIGDGSYTIQRTKIKNKSPFLTIHCGGTEVMPNSDTRTKQEWLEKLIGINKLGFHITSMFHQDFIAFPDLKPAERAAILTDIGDLSCWVDATDKAKKSNTELGADIYKLTTTKDALDEKVDYLHRLDYEAKQAEFEETRVSQVIDQKRALKELKSKLATETSIIEKKRSEIKKKLSTLAEQHKDVIARIAENKFDLNDSNEKGKLLIGVSSELRTKQNALEQLSKDLAKWNKTGTGVCPTCKQEVTKTHIKNHASTMEKEIGILTKEVETQKKIRDNIVKELEKMKQLNDLYNMQNDEKYKIEKDIEFQNKCLKTEDGSALKFIENHIASAEKQLKGIREKINPYTEFVESTKVEITNLLAKAEETAFKISDLKTEMGYNTFWIEGYKKIKILLFESMIDQLQAFTEEILQNYSSNVTVNISNQRDTKSGTKKDEVFIEVLNNGRSIGYKSYSGGERQKIKMAISLGLAKLIEAQSDRSFNFIAFDEPNNALDDVGKEANAKMLLDLAEQTNKVVFVVDHDAYFKDQFDNQLIVVKENDSSFISQP